MGLLGFSLTPSIVSIVWFFVNEYVMLLNCVVFCLCCLRYLHGILFNVNECRILIYMASKNMEASPNINRTMPKFLYQHRLFLTSTPTLFQASVLVLNTDA
jgi:hypothetical protein